MKPEQSLQEIAESADHGPSPEATEFVSLLTRLPEPLRRGFIGMVQDLARRS